MTLGVYDPDFKFGMALDIVRRYVDRHAAYTQKRDGIQYRQYRERREWRQLHTPTGAPIKTKAGHNIFTPQYVQDVCIMSKEAALRMVQELSQE